MKTRMVYVPLDWTAFCRWAGNRRLIRQGAFDEGFALHVLLSAVFGKAVLQPYRLLRPGRASIASLYGYSDVDQRVLRDMAQAVATPDCIGVLGLDDLATKEMPERLRKGQRLGFDVRVRPIRRLGQSLHDSQSGRVLRKGSELDAFRLELLHRSPDGWRNPATRVDLNGISRQSVYADWLADRLAGAADMDTASCRLIDFRRSRAWRGNGRSSEGPDATLQGECVVRDPEAFATMLRRGVGRHRAYGYGMLIPRPPGRASQTRNSPG